VSPDMMSPVKKFLVIILISICFLTPSQADNIEDLEIDGIGIGDSLLDFYTKSEISNFKIKTYDKGLFNVLTTNTNSELYSELGFHVKVDDKKFIIHSIKGIKRFKNRFQECMKFKDEVVKEISTILNDANFINYVADYTDKDMGNSKAHVSMYAFPSQKGIVRVWCTQYDKKNWL
jgi:hypothetical protein